MSDPVCRHLQTCSKKAMPRLMKMTVIRGADLTFRWPYHAKVMKMLET
jgi:putative component of membrane protein insertase Oxa1/YidC/SpoIIIJ protein YidD